MQNVGQPFRVAIDKGKAKALPYALPYGMKCF
jgi:hypothetical protein